MTIKSKISFFVSSLFTVLFGLICFFIVQMFAEFRRQEFKESLKHKAIASVKLMIDLKEDDEELLETIDQKATVRAHNEKTLIFDSAFTQVYASNGTATINWSAEDLKSLKKTKHFFRNQGGNEVYGLYFEGQPQNYMVLVSAYDNFGKRKLEYLIFLLLTAYLFFTLLTWFFTFYIVKYHFAPLDQFQKKIKNINDLKSTDQLHIKPNSNNEIELLRNEFNAMMKRIADVHLKQKEFTAQASHELRTPLARMSLRLENQMHAATGPEKEFFKSLLQDVTQLNELIGSLLLLSKVETSGKLREETCLIDEVVYASIDKMQLHYPDFKPGFHLHEVGSTEQALEINASGSLMEIAVTNLLKNAYLYSENHSCDIHIHRKTGILTLDIVSYGDPLTPQEQGALFQPFKRGGNSAHQQGIGLGLRIVQRICHAFDFSIDYRSSGGENIFSIVFCM